MVVYLLSWHELAIEQVYFVLAIFWQSMVKQNITMTCLWNFNLLLEAISFNDIYCEECVNGDK